MFTTAGFVRKFTSLDFLDTAHQRSCINGSRRVGIDRPVTGGVAMAAGLHESFLVENNVKPLPICCSAPHVHHLKAALTVNIINQQDHRDLCLYSEI